jgi:hypothetical protein
MRLKPGLFDQTCRGYHDDRPYDPTALLEFAVPFALVILLLDITLVYHASRTGRLQPWAFIILMIPGIGALAYIVVELVPEMLSRPGAQRARRRVADRLDPEKLYRELSDRLAATDTIANRVALAAECQRIERFNEAERRYDHILQLPLATIRSMRWARRRPSSVAIVRPRRSRRWTICKKAGRIFNPQKVICSMPGHWARSGASMRRLRSFMRSQPTSQARRRVRCGLLLNLVGRAAEARVVFNELLIQMRRAPKYLRQAEAEWLSIAEKQLSA